MTEQNGIWTAEVELQEGLYCYKFYVDGEYILIQTIQNGLTVVILKILLFVFVIIFARNLVLNWLLNRLS